MSDEMGVEELKGRIVQTREELGETVQALAAKADVKARASGAVHAAVGSVKAKARNAVGDARATAHDAAGNARSRAQDAAGNARAKVQGVAGGAKEKAAGTGAKARALASRDAGAGDPDALAVEGDTAQVVPACGPTDADRRLTGTLTAIAVGALLAALIVWLSGRRRS